MTKKVVYLILTLISAVSFSQDVFTPSILILAPNQGKYPKEFEKEIKKTNRSIEQFKNPWLAVMANDPNFKSGTDPMTKMKIAKVEFEKELDIFKLSSNILEHELSMNAISSSNTPYVLLSKDKSEGEINTFQALADMERCQFVINILSVEFYGDLTNPSARIRIQLYDNLQHKIILDEEFSGGSALPNLHFMCEPGSLACAVGNSIQNALSPIFSLIIENDPFLRKEFELKQARKKSLDVKKAFERTSIERFKTLALTRNVSIDDLSVYGVIWNNDSTKFVYFSMKKENLFKDMDMSDPLVKNSRLMDPTLHFWTTYGIIHKGLIYQEEEFGDFIQIPEENINKELVAMEDLTNHNFFLKESSEFNPDFWQINLFEVEIGRVSMELKEIEDLKKDNDQKEIEKFLKYYNENLQRYKDEDKDNEEFIGLCKIVSNQLKAERRSQDSLIMNSLTEQLLTPFINAHKGKQEIKKSLNEIDPILFIFPKDRSVFLIRLFIELEKEVSKFYFVVIAKDSNNEFALYQWNFISQDKIPNSTSGQDLLNTLSPFTNWNFLYEHLNDEQFWDNCVLKKENNEYKYLQKLKF